MALASLLAAAALLLCGHALLALARPRRARSALERHATALLLGLVVPPCLLASAVVWLGPLAPVATRGLLALGAVAGALVLVLRRARGDERRQPAARASALERVGAGLALAFAGFALLYGATMPIKSFDATYHYAYKGKLIHGEGVATDGWTDMHSAVGRPHTHPRYPPLVPALHAIVAGVGGSFDEHATRPLFALFALATAALLYATLRPRGRAPALAAALAWITLPFLYYSGVSYRSTKQALAGFLLGPERVRGFHLPQGYTLDGAADLPLAALCLGACVHAWRLLPRAGLARDRADAWIAGALLAGCALCKSEGVALVCVLALSLALSARVARLVDAPRTATDATRPLALLLRVLAPLAALCGSWLVARGTLPDIDEGYAGRLAALPGELERFGRSARILAGYAECLLPFLSGSFVRWGLVWPLFLAALAWSLARPRALLRHPALAPVAFVAGGLLLYYLVLLVTPWNLDELFETLIPDRLVLHLTPVAILATGALLWRRPEEARG